MNEIINNIWSNLYFSSALEKGNKAVRGNFVYVANYFVIFYLLRIE